MKFFLKIVVVLVSLILTVLAGIYLGDMKLFYDTFIVEPVSPDNTVNVNTGSTMTGTSVLTGMEISHYSKTLIQDKDFWKFSQLSKNMFGEMKVDRMPKDLKLVAVIDFSDTFKSKYTDYTLSNGYGFALKFFLGDFENGGFYNVFRKLNGGLGNDSSQGLNGLKFGSEINGGNVWTIPLDSTIKVAVPFEKVATGYQFTYFDPRDYIKLGERFTVGTYLSSTKEIEGWRLLKIKELRVEYFGYKDDVLVAQ